MAAIIDGHLSRWVWGRLVRSGALAAFGDRYDLDEAQYAACRLRVHHALARVGLVLLALAMAFFRGDLS